MKKNIFFKFIIVLSLTFFVSFLAKAWGMSLQQSLSIGILVMSILGTVFFWDIRLSFALLGTSALLLTKTIDLENLIQFASLDVILFLVGMMVLIGLLKESGLFAWIVQLILRIKNLNANKFLFSISLISALLACVVDEVTSIIFVVAAILEICDYFEVNPVPFIIISVLATNIGSSGTVLGNPIGILIAVKSGLNFEDFIVKAFPLMLVCLLVSIMIIKFWYRKALLELDRKIKELGANEILIRLISIPPERQLKIGLGIFGITLIFIALHHRLELLFNVNPNTILLIVPLVSSAFVMVWRSSRARHYIEKDVEWWTLLFFMLLFAQAGALKYTGATSFIANKIITKVGSDPFSLIGTVIWISSIGSSVLDNVVIVAAFIPMVQSFKDIGVRIQPLWWALLFGGCLGGNITIIGSTANIIAVGILEKERKISISFIKWLGIGLVIGIITTTIIWFALAFIPIYH